MGMKDSSEITGGRSRVRFAAGQPIEFVVRSAFAVAGIDPNTFYALRLLHNKKDKREIIFMMGHATPIGASTSSDLASGVLPVEFSKYGKSSYKVTTPALKPGEWAGPPCHRLFTALAWTNDGVGVTSGRPDLMYGPRDCGVTETNLTGVASYARHARLERRTNNLRVIFS